MQGLPENTLGQGIQKPSANEGGGRHLGDLYIPNRRCCDTLPAPSLLEKTGSAYGDLKAQKLIPERMLLRMGRIGRLLQCSHKPLLFI